MSGRTSRPVREGVRAREELSAIAAAFLPAVFVLLPVLAFAAARLASGEGRAEFLNAALSARSYRVALFTIAQALLSALLASLAGIPLGFVASRGPVVLRKPLKALFSIPMAVPSILVAIGFAGFYGISGRVNDFLRAMGGDKPIIVYGLTGILLAHAFYNFPLTGRLVADALAEAEGSRIDAARLLGAGTLRRFFTIDLREAFPGIAAAFLISFIYCLQSFGIVLLLGGGPGASTLEVEIYEALRTSFREGRAIFLGLVSMGVSAAAALLHARIAQKSSRPSGRETGQNPGAFGEKKPGITALGWSYAFFLLVFVGGPALTVIVEAFRPQRGGIFPSLDQFSFLLKGGLDSSIFKASFNTLTIGLMAGVLSTLLALFCAALRGKARSGGMTAIARVVPLAVSPILLSSGLGLLGGSLSERILLPLFHALIAFPLASSAIEAGLEKLPPSLLDAARCLGSDRMKAFIDVAVPAIIPSVLTSAAFSFAISAADISGVLCLARSDFPTLSLLVYRLAGSYRFGAACAAGLVLLAMTGIAFGFSEKKR